VAGSHLVWVYGLVRVKADRCQVVSFPAAVMSTMHTDGAV